MQFARNFLAILALAVGMDPAGANDPVGIDPSRLVVAPREVDLTKIKRALAREPAYQSKKPQYCLLVFGPKAATHVWLVLDGGVLYVDRNGNGDLTEANERALPSPTGCLNGGDIVEWPSGTKHTSLKVFRDPKLGVSMSISIAGKLEQVCRLKFASRPEEAPIVHFNGPVFLRLNLPCEILKGEVQLLNAAVGPSGVLRRGRPAYLCGALGTPGLGEGAFARYRASDLLPGPALAVEFEFPGEDKDQVPLRAKGLLQPMDDGLGGELEGSVRVPAKARQGTVKISLSVPGDKNVQLMVVQSEVEVIGE